MSNKLWRSMWKNDETAFHQLTVNPLLARFLPQLRLAPSSRILVPLCGKSLDMNYLADKGYHVVGIELSSIAIKAYFDALEVNPSRQRVGSFTRWRHGKTEIWGGDIFDLTTKDLQQDSILYDCASLTAFPAEQRPEYIRHFYERMPERSQIVLVTTETADQGVADSVTAVDSEVQDLYEPYYSIELIYGGHRIKQDPTNPFSSHSEMEEKIYLMKSL